MYVDVELITAKRADALLITKRALLYDGELQLCFPASAGTERSSACWSNPRSPTNSMSSRPAGFKEGDQIVVAGQTGTEGRGEGAVAGRSVPGREESYERRESAGPAAAKKS